MWKDNARMLYAFPRLVAAVITATSISSDPCDAEPWFPGPGRTGHAASQLKTQSTIGPQ